MRGESQRVADEGSSKRLMRLSRLKQSACEHGGTAEGQSRDRDGRSRGVLFMFASVVPFDALVFRRCDVDLFQSISNDKGVKKCI